MEEGFMAESCPKTSYWNLLFQSCLPWYLCWAQDAVCKICLQFGLTKLMLGKYSAIFCGTWPCFIVSHMLCIFSKWIRIISHVPTLIIIFSLISLVQVQPSLLLNTPCLENCLLSLLDPLQPNLSISSGLMPLYNNPNLQFHPLQPTPTHRIIHQARRLSLSSIRSAGYCLQLS